MTTDRPRADAVRNAAALVAAGRRMLRSSGPDFAFSAVAREAGLGQATLYRHFASKADLVAAIVTENVEQLERDLARATDDHPDRRVADVLSHVAASLVDNVELTQLLVTQVATHGPVDVEHRVVTAVRAAMGGSAASPPDGLVALALQMLAAAVVIGPPDGRVQRAQDAVAILAHGLAPPGR